MNVTSQQSKYTLCLSNLAYLFPASIVLYKMIRPGDNKLNKADGSSLIILFIFVAIFSSWSYHSCRSDLTSNGKFDKNATHTTLNFQNTCQTCPDSTMSFVNSFPGSNEPMSFQLSRFIDHYTAILTLVMVILHTIPLHEKIRKLLLVISLLWMILFLSAGNEAFALVPAILMLIMLLIFWFMIRKNKESGFFTRNKIWALSFVFMIAAFICFKIDSEPYWMNHSQWHIYGSIAAGLLLSKTAICYADINLDQIHIPTTMLNMFTNPYECR